MAPAAETDLRYDALRSLRRTHQVREFTDEPVADEDLQAILDVARWSGSSSNRQPWTFGLIRPGPIRDRVARLAPRARGASTAAITVAISMPGENDEWDAYDDGRVAERMLVAATALGLGASLAWARDSARRDIAALFGLDPPAFVRTLVSIGHPTPAAARPRAEPGTARKPLSEFVREAR